MSLKVRKAEENDFEKIHSLNRMFARFIKTPEKIRISVDDMKKGQQHFTMLVAEKSNGEIVGFASMFIAWYSWIGKSMYLDDLFVLEEYRNRGLGNKLMEKVIELAKKEDCKKLRWQVSRWNARAIEFYMRKGAVIDDVEINCDLVL